MGIVGLLPLVNPAMTKTNIRQIPGKTVGIDVSCWLHTAASADPVAVVLYGDYSSVIDYCVRRLNLVARCGKRPIVVFDGAPLPEKKGTDSRRCSERVAALDGANYCLIRKDIDNAVKLLKKSVSITFDMKQAVMNVLRKMGIDYVVAPYEADAQLTHLAISGHVDTVITEDSDLIVYGCKSIFFKMDSRGNGDLFDSSKLPGCFSGRIYNFSMADFRRMCILSGCDYLPSIYGVGLRKAEKAFLTTPNLTVKQALSALKVKVPDDYAEKFYKAEQIFLRQMVFDVSHGVRVPLRLPDTGIQIEIDTEEILNRETAFQLAIGNIDPGSTDERVDNYDISRVCPSDYLSIWSQLSRSRQMSETG